MTYPSKVCFNDSQQKQKSKQTKKDMSFMRITQILRKCKNSLIYAIEKLKGSDKRISLAMIANDIGRGGQSNCF